MIWALPLLSSGEMAICSPSIFFCIAASIRFFSSS
jgi:hypothetical protein